MVRSNCKQLLEYMYLLRKNIVSIYSSDIQVMKLFSGDSKDEFGPRHL